MGDHQAESVIESGDPRENGTGPNAAPLLSEEEREALKSELIKTEEEITALRQVLAARLQHSSELKRKLGLSPWREFQHDVSEGLKTVKESQAVKKTNELAHVAGEKATTAFSTLGKKLGDIRNSGQFKSFEQQVGTAYSSVRAKISASASMDQFSGRASSQATTPSANVASFGADLNSPSELQEKSKTP